MLKIDRNGWEYHDKLPEGFRLATMDDFHIGGKKKVGMQYLIQRGYQQYFEVHHITENSRAVNLKPFLDHQMVFVKDQ